MNILVLGGRGFLGRYVVEALKEHQVLTADTRPGSKNHLVVDIAQPRMMQRAAKDVDLIINVVGLSPLRQGPFQTVHVQGVRNILATKKPLIHISALGADSESSIDYMRTKGEAEDLITASGVPHAIIRPSVLFGEGAELFRQLDRLPIFPRLPTKVQPVFADDVAQFISSLLAAPQGVHELAGSEVMTMYQFATRYRTVLPIPFLIFKPFFWLACTLRIAKLSPNQYQSLFLNNTTSPHPNMTTEYNGWVQRKKK